MRYHVKFRVRLCGSPPRFSMTSRPSGDLVNVRKTTQAAPRICASLSSVARGLTTNVLSVDFFGGFRKEDAVSHVYDLEALMIENGLRLVHKKGKVDKERSAEYLLTSIIQGMQTGYECTSYANRELCGVQALRYDNLVSLKQKPDVAVVVDTGIPLDGDATLKLPILLAEMHSKDSSSPAQSYEHTKNKLIIEMVDQFRYLTNYCDEASSLQLTGFVFPADGETFGVMEVKLFLSCESGESFEFQFIAIEKYLPKAHVRVSIEQTISTALRLQFREVVGHLCYLRLSTDHVQAISASAGTNSDSLRQVKTPSSILLTNGTEYIKVYPLDHRMSRFIYSPPPLKQFLLPTRVHFGQIYIFPALPYSPLTREEAKHCLTKLVEGVANALKEIHGNPHFIAHVDVRLENICFDENGTPILIDPDRINDSRRSAFAPSYEGLLYIPKRTEWKMSNIDWMQLGYMVAYIVQSDYQYYPQEMEIDDEISRDPFVMALINEGTYSETLKQVSDELNKADHQMAILDVLGQRN